MSVYRELCDFPGWNEEIKVFVPKNFLNSVLNFMLNDIVIHHSHISGNIIGYAHSFCNLKIRESYQKTISVFAHNLFRFDFFCIERIEVVCLEN